MGPRYQVNHPEFIMIGKTLTTIGLLDEGDQQYFGRSIAIPLLHIAPIGPVSRTANTSGQ